MTSPKADAKQFKAFLSGLEKEDWIKRTERRWWPRFVFHYTDLENAVRILKGGYIYSRRYMENNDVSWIDCASTDIIAETSEDVKQCVRLYFRPKTPTQYHQEGIKSRATLSDSHFPDAHCPIPIFFLFDSAEILSRSDCRFSNGNLVSAFANIYSTAEELETLPWKMIYHDRYLVPELRKKTIFHRNAEVIIPQQLGFESLKYIYCRSVAEKETFLYLLPKSLRQRNQNRIVSTTRRMPFFRKYTFVESVALTRRNATFRFSPDTRSPGPFSARLEIENLETHETLVWRKNNLSAKGVVRKIFKRDISNYAIKLFLDEHITYANEFIDLEMPF